MEEKNNIEENSIPEIIGIKDILDMLGVINKSIELLAQSVSQIIEIQNTQEEKINKLLNNNFKNINKKGE